MSPPDTALTVNEFVAGAGTLLLLLRFNKLVLEVVIVEALSEALIPNGTPETLRLIVPLKAASGNAEMIVDAVLPGVILKATFDA